MTGWPIRVATGLIALVAGLVAFLDGIPRDIPAYAFGDAGVLRAERGLAVLVILLVILVILWRGIVEGDLPSEITREGIKYRQVALSTENAIAGLEVNVTSQQGSIKELTDIAKLSSQILAEHQKQIVKLTGEPADEAPKQA